MPQWILRRLAIRSLNVLDRHKDREPSLTLYTETLGKTAPAFIAAHQAAVAQAVSRSDKMQDRHASVDQLLRKMRSWTAALVNDVENLDRTRYGDRRNVPEEVVGDAKELLALLARREEEGKEMPFYSDDLRADLQAAIDATQIELAAAGGSNATIVELQRVAREAGDAFKADLIAFRRSLRAFVGTSHPDYQKLRVVRGQPAVLEDEDDQGQGGDAPANAPGIDGAVELLDDEDDELERAS